jgi:hypothetical protein
MLKIMVYVCKYSYVRPVLDNLARTPTSFSSRTYQTSFSSYSTVQYQHLRKKIEKFIFFCVRQPIYVVLALTIFFRMNLNKLEKYR